jgi:hypothetical protein
MLADITGHSAEEWIARLFGSGSIIHRVALGVRDRRGRQGRLRAAYDARG